MKVIHVLGHGAVGGMETHVRDLILAQVRRGIVPDLVCWQVGGPVTDFLTQRGIRIYYCGARSGHDPLGAIRLASVLRRVDADIAHFHAFPLLGSAAAILTRSTVVATCHLVGGARDRVARSAYSTAVASAIAVSEDVRSEMRRTRTFPRASWSVIPNGVDLRKFGSPRLRLVRRPGPLRLGSVGRLAPDKHPIDLIDAWAIVRRSRPDATLQLIGDGVLRSAVAARAAELGLQADLTLWGTQVDVSARLADLDLFMLTSEAETFGLAALESMAAGVPVLSYPLRGGVNEWIHRGGALVADARTPAALARIVLKATDQESVYQELCGSAIQTAQRHSIEHTVEKTLDVYDQARARSASLLSAY